MKTARSISCAALLILSGCRQAEPPFGGNKTPVNAQPTPELSATGAPVTGTDATPSATPPQPGTPPPALAPSPVPPAALPSPGA